MLVYLGNFMRNAGNGVIPFYCNGSIIVAIVTTISFLVYFVISRDVLERHEKETYYKNETLHNNFSLNLLNV